MSLPRDEDDLLPELPPLEPLDDDGGEEGDPHLAGTEPEVDIDDDEPVSLDASEGMDDGLDAADLIDDAGEGDWTTGTEEAGDIAGDALEGEVSAEGAEYGWTDDNEASDLDVDDDFGLGSDDGSVLDDAGEEGVDDLHAQAAGDDDDAVELPPLDAGAGERDDAGADDLDLSGEDDVDLDALGFSDDAGDGARPGGGASDGPPGDGEDGSGGAGDDDAGKGGG